MQARALGQARQNLDQPYLNPGNHFAGIGSRQTEHQTFDGFALAVARHRTVAGERPDTYVGDIAQSYHSAVTHGDDYRPQIVWRLDTAFFPHQ